MPQACNAHANQGGRVGCKTKCGLQRASGGRDLPNTTPHHTTPHHTMPDSVCLQSSEPLKHSRADTRAIHARTHTHIHT